jgi:hypothetical protein
LAKNEANAVTKMVKKSESKKALAKAEKKET